MTTILNASNGATSGLIATGDNSGVLQLQTNNGTPALTLNATQALGVGSSPSYGTSGQLLQSNGSSSAPSWVASPATNPAGSTGQVQYNNAGAFGAVSAGTSGQVLTSAGSGSVPTWTTPSAGAMTLISTLTASYSSTLSFTGLGSYNKYLIIYDNLVSVGNRFNYTRIGVQLGYGSTTYVTSNYGWANWLVDSGGSSQQNYSTTDSMWIIAGNAPDPIYAGNSGFTSGSALITGIQTSSGKTIVAHSATPFSGGGSTNVSCETTTGTNTTMFYQQLTAIQLVVIGNTGQTGGSFASGTVSLYGISS